MAIRPGLCNSYKREILSGGHSDKHTYAIALYTDDANLDSTTTQYTHVGEVSGKGYPRGGVLLEGFSVTGDKVACLDFDDVLIPNATISADGALIYNMTAGKKAVAVVRFQERITSTNGPFTIEMTPVGERSSLIRIA